MTGNEACSKCPLTLDQIRQGGKETMCAALGGTSDFGRFEKECLAVAMLRDIGKSPNNFAQLLQLFPKLKLGGGEMRGSRRYDRNS